MKKRSEKLKMTEQEQLAVERKKELLGLEGDEVGSEALSVDSEVRNTIW